MDFYGTKLMLVPVVLIFSYFLQTLQREPVEHKLLKGTRQTLLGVWTFVVNVRREIHSVIRKTNLQMYYFWVASLPNALAKDFS